MPSDQSPAPSDAAAPVAAKADGPQYERFLSDMLSSGLAFVDVSNADFNGRGVLVHDLAAVAPYTDVPCTLTVVNGKYVAHPVVALRFIP